MQVAQAGLLQPLLSHWQDTARAPAHSHWAAAATLTRRTDQAMDPNTHNTSAVASALHHPPQGPAASPLAQQCWGAHQRITFRIRQTPLEPSPWLSTAGGCHAYLKLESEQHTGSFKARGAVNKVMSLSHEQLAAGLVTCSTGNHALAFLYACSTSPAARRAKALVYLPTTASPAKIAKLRQRGADVVLFGQDSVEAEREARSCGFVVFKCKPTGMMRCSIPMQVMAGQGSVAVELLSQLPEGVDVIFVPVGGGGLIGGIAAVLKAAAPGCRVVGCQPAASDVMRQSVAAGHVVDVPIEDTLSDGTAGGIEHGSVTLAPCMDYVDEWVVVSEQEIADAMVQLLQHHSKLVEGAAGCAIAAFHKLKDQLKGKHAVVVCCGGNVALPALQKVLQMGRQTP